MWFVQGFERLGQSVGRGRFLRGAGAKSVAWGVVLGALLLPCATSTAQPRTASLPSVGFSSGLTTTTEQPATVTLSVVLSDAVGSDGAWVDFTATGTATNGADYTMPNGGALIFDPFSASVDSAIVQDAKLLSADAKEGSMFGSAVDMQGDTAVIGSMRTSGVSTFAGAAYIFTRLGGTWTQTKKLFSSSGGDDYFTGARVALDGDTVVVANVSDYHAAVMAGSATIFERDHGGANNWGEVKTITASDSAPRDMFSMGLDVAGDTVAVGSPQEWDMTTSGAVYIYERDFGGADNWGQVQKITPTDGAVGDQFGWSVVVTSTTLLVGARLADAPTTNCGAVYVFAKSGPTWSQQAKLTASDADAEDWFGGGMALDGDTLLVGAWRDDERGTDAGAAYVFVRSGSTWTQQAKLTAPDSVAEDGFGMDGGLSVTGDRAAVGLPIDGIHRPDARGFYLFQRQGTQWFPQAKVRAGDGYVYHFFGASVGFAIAMEGDTILVGDSSDDASGGAAGALYVFRLSSDPVRISIQPDHVDEYDETVQVELSQPVNVSLGTTPTQTVTILDDDDPPTMGLQTGAVSVGEAAGTAITTVVLTGNNSEKPISVRYTTTDGTAHAPGDYTATTGTATFARLARTCVFAVPIVSDAVDELDKTFSVSLSSPSDAPLGTSVTETVTIVDDDAPPVVGFTTGVLSVGESAGTAVTTVALTGNATEKTVSVAYATSDGTAQAPGDYAATSGTVTFTPPARTQAVPIPVANDAIDEFDKTFMASLSAASEATLGPTSTQTCTIVDDDAPPTIGLTQTRLVTPETASPVTLSVSLTGNATEKTVSANYATRDETASAGSDYSPRTGTVTLTPPLRSQDITVPILNDSERDPDETFRVILSGQQNALLGPWECRVVIDDDDSSPTAANVWELYR